MQEVKTDQRYQQRQLPKAIKQNIIFHIEWLFVSGLIKSMEKKVQYNYRS